jgi:hypothetical protein
MQAIHPLILFCFQGGGGGDLEEMMRNMGGFGGGGGMPGGFDMDDLGTGLI